jgi:hypothetical protein
MTSNKCLYTVCVDNYLPELMRYTLPNLEGFAKKIGADFKIIDSRKYPEFPATYEKMQIHELGAGYQWNILVDADCMFFPGMFDPTRVIPFDHVGFQEQFNASLLFQPDAYFYRDGRKLGVATNFCVVPISCHDVWTPLEMSWEEAREKTKREFIIDEFCISRNIARYGLKYTGILDTGFEGLFKHFDVSTSAPDLDAVVAQAKQWHEEWKF